VRALGGLDGLESMDPDGVFLRSLNSGGETAAAYAAVASDFEPLPGANGLAVAKDMLFDAIFRAENDLVVPTDGIFAANGSPNFPMEQVLHLTPRPTVVAVAPSTVPHRPA